jgi:D-xylose transport system substrate-binding protein
MSSRKNLVRLTVCFGISLPLLLIFSACCSAWAQSEEKIKIGFAIEAMNGERWQTDMDAFKARAKQLGALVLSADARGDDERQLQQVKDMIRAGIRALVLLPHDTSKASRIVETAKAANVKVVSYDRLVLNSDVDLYVSFDRLEIGWLQADYLAKHAPKGNYVLIAGSPNDEGARILHDAQMKVLRPYIERGDIKVIADGYTKEWLPTEAYLAMLKAIESSHGDIAAVLASNDGMAGGAIQALREHHLAGKVLVTGQDADLTAIIAIVQGAQSMTVYKPVGSEATVAAEEAVRLAKGEKSRANKTVNNGKTDVPAILLKPIVVTKENIKPTVVKDGFQTLKRINEGLPANQQIN